LDEPPAVSSHKKRKAADAFDEDSLKLQWDAVLQALNNPTGASQEEGKAGIDENSLRMGLDLEAVLDGCYPTSASQTECDVNAIDGEPLTLKDCSGGCGSGVCKSGEQIRT
jgi:hypothetical protein